VTLAAGSLCSGYGGLDEAVCAFFGATLTWVADNSPAAAKALAARYPGVTNLGDISAVSWETVEPPEIIVGGFPCQDVSLAGKLAGLAPGTRSGVWVYMAKAIGVLHPSLVVIENVRGLLSARAHSNLEPCPWCVGEAGGKSLRALGAVLGDLASLGYDAEWEVVPASAAGGCHERKRVFILAWPAAHTLG